MAEKWAQRWPGSLPEVAQPAGEWGAGMGAPVPAHGFPETQLFSCKQKQGVEILLRLNFILYSMKEIKWMT